MRDLKDIKIGFIGAGNMGSSLINGIKKSGCKIHVFDKVESNVINLLENNIFASASIEDLIKESDFIFLCVKPDQMKQLMEEISKSSINISNKTFISIAAGLKISFFKNIITNIKIVRVMPNMPAAIQKGMSVLFSADNIQEDEINILSKLMEYTGKLLILDNEEQMDIATAVSGSGPAFVFMFLKHIISAAQSHGLTHEQARLLSHQMMSGAVEYSYLSNKDLDHLVNSICSPNGTTIQGINTLKDNAFGDIVESAVRASYQRSLAMSDTKAQVCEVVIYTDGACLNNPGEGGYAAVLMYEQVERIISGYKEYTTNNEMELTAALEALRVLKKPCHVSLHSDSAYLINGFNNGWVENWKRNGWKRNKNEEIKNLQIWKQLDELNKIHDIKWIKVKGHSDNKYNNLCDKLAGEAIKNKGLDV